VRLTATWLNDSKIISSVVSFFSSNYVMRWADFMPDTPLLYAPMFDARAVAYPSLQNLRDYLSWRQADSTKLPLQILAPMLLGCYIRFRHSAKLRT